MGQCSYALRTRGGPRASLHPSVVGQHAFGAQQFQLSGAQVGRRPAGCADHPMPRQIRRIRAHDPADDARDWKALPRRRYRRRSTPARPGSTRRGAHRFDLLVGDRRHLSPAPAACGSPPRCRPAAPGAPCGRSRTPASVKSGRSPSAASSSSVTYGGSVFVARTNVIGYPVVRQLNWSRQLTPVRHHRRDADPPSRAPARAGRPGARRVRGPVRPASTSPHEPCAFSVRASSRSV